GGIRLNVADVSPTQEVKLGYHGTSSQSQIIWEIQSHLIWNLTPAMAVRPSAKSASTRASDPGVLNAGDCGQLRLDNAGEIVSRRGCHRLMPRLKALANFWGQSSR